MTGKELNNQTATDSEGSIFLRNFHEKPPVTLREVDACDFELLARGESANIGLEKAIEVHQTLERIRKGLSDAAQKDENYDATTLQSNR